MKEKDRFALRMNMIVDLYDSGCYSFEDIGMVFGVTRERVRQVYLKGKRKVNASSIYGEMEEGITQTMKQRLIDAEALKAELTGRIALPDWVLTAVLHIIDNTPTASTVMRKANFDYCPNCGAKMKEAENE